MLSSDTKLYKGSVLIRFNEGNHRYTVSTDGETWEYKLGVTTILKSLAKEALMLWPMDEALKTLFGQEFAEIRLDSGDTVFKPVYVPSKALLGPNTPYSPAVLQNALETARMAHMVKRDKGGDVGTLVHQQIEAYLNKQPITPTGNKEADKAVDAFRGWFEKEYDNGLRVLNTEQVVYSKQFDYCGTYDALFEKDDKKILVDFKTSNYSRTAPLGIYAENFLQLAAYAQAYTEELKTDIDDYMVINCSKQGKVSTKTVSELGVSTESLQNLFTSVLSIYKGIKNLEFKLKEKV